MFVYLTNKYVTYFGAVALRGSSSTGDTSQSLSELKSSWKNEEMVNMFSDKQIGLIKFQKVH